jgi:hypothetical protein
LPSLSTCCANRPVSFHLREVICWPSISPNDYRLIRAYPNKMWRSVAGSAAGSTKYGKNASTLAPADMQRIN